MNDDNEIETILNQVFDGRIEALYQNIKIGEEKSNYYNEKLNQALKIGDKINSRKYDTILSLITDIDVHDDHIFEYLESLDDDHILRFHKFIELKRVYSSFIFKDQYQFDEHISNKIDICSVKSDGSKVILDELVDIMESIDPLDNTYLSLEHIKAIDKLYDTDDRIGIVIEEDMVTKIISNKENRRPVEFLDRSEDLPSDFA